MMVETSHTHPLELITYKYPLFLSSECISLKPGKQTEEKWLIGTEFVGKFFPLN
jgi:hypothetical protein